MKVFSKKFIVSKEHIDDLNHVNNIVYLQWSQDLAQMHWNHLKEGHKTDAYVWVVLRHEIDYSRQALLNDEITANTWVGETAGIKSVRHFEFYKNSQLLVKAQTTFCLLDSKTFKPARITDAILNILEDK